jgi:hypothetical protein
MAAILKSEGIRTTVGLLRAATTPKQRLKIAAKTGANSKEVLDWATAAVKTANDLQCRNPQKLVEKMQEANKHKLVRLLPKERTVERWIESAKNLPPLIRY